MIPDIPQTGLPGMTPEGSLVSRRQLFYTSPYAPGAYIIKGGTFVNDTGVALADGTVVEGLLVSYDPTNDIWVPYNVNDDLNGENMGAAGVLEKGYGGALANAARVLLPIIVSAKGGLRCSALAVTDGVSTVANFVTNYNAAANTASIGSAKVSAGIDLDPVSGGGLGPVGSVLFFG